MSLTRISTSVLLPSVTANNTSVYVCNVYMYVCVFLLPVPSMPQNPVYVNSTERSITLSWKQSGTVDDYIIEYNDTNALSVNLTGVGSVNVSAIVGSLPTSGAYYCITVTAVSGHLQSEEAELCNYTGNAVF